MVSSSAFSSLSLLIFLSFLPSFYDAHPFNVIDDCWRAGVSWQTNRQKLATCSVGFSGKMTDNIGKDLIIYQVSDPSDNPMYPKRGTLRYGATKLRGRVWITFQRSMTIRLYKPLFISSFTTIDGRGADVHITGSGCLVLNEVKNVVIHGLNIHHCKSQLPGLVIRPTGFVSKLGGITDGDAIRVINSSKIWIDHNTLYDCEDGLLDVSRGSTRITISNNWFRNQDKVMLLGHEDSHKGDRNMKVTVILNRFGPYCNQRMPRVRHGYVHVANNYYNGWRQYAIGGSMVPTVISERNHFFAPYDTNSKEVTWNENPNEPGLFYSTRDILENGATFSGKGQAKVLYSREEAFNVVDRVHVERLTRRSGAFKL